MSKQGFESRSHRENPELQRLRDLTEPLGFGLEEFTLYKIIRFRELPSQGLTLREAQEILKENFGEELGWEEH